MKSKREFLCTFLFISSGIICAALYCLVDGKMITDIYLPSGSWNDEVFYYKQIEAAINYGLPQGYFGYGETSAEYLTYGAWSVCNFVALYFVWKDYRRMENTFAYFL